MAMEYTAMPAKPELTFEENLCALYEEGESFGIPSDVKFLLRGMGATRKTISAHKMILAMASPVFQRQFYSERDDTEREIEVYDFSFEEFDAMIRYIYGAKVNLPWFDVKSLVSLHSLAVRYEMEDFQEEIVKEIIVGTQQTSSGLDLVNLVGDMKIMDQNATVAKLLLDQAAVKMKDSSQSSDTLYHDLCNLGCTEELISEMLDKMDLSSYCQNCKRQICLDGAGLSVENFVPSALVRVAQPRAGRGNAAVHRTGVVLNSGAEFSAFTRSLLPLPPLKLCPEVYIFNCSEYVD